MKNMAPHLFSVVALASLLTPPSLPAQNPATNPAARMSLDNAWLARHKGFVAEAKKGGIDLLFLGDSITDHWRNSGKAVWDKYYFPRHAANFGIGGDRTENVLWRIAHGELDGINPEVIVLMIGTNNSDNQDPNSVAEGIELVVHNVRAKCPASKILLLALLPRGEKNSSFPARIKETNRRIARLEDGEMIRFLDFGSKYLGPDGAIMPDTMPDLEHPSEKGYQIWADAMESTLVKMMK